MAPLAKCALQPRPKRKRYVETKGESEGAGGWTVGAMRRQAMLLRIRAKEANARNNSDFINDSTGGRATVT